MTANYTTEPEPNWDEVFSNTAVLDVLCEIPLNSAAFHDEDEDAAILANLEVQAPWIRRVMKLSMEAVNSGGR